MNASAIAQLGQTTTGMLALTIVAA